MFESLLPKSSVFIFWSLVSSCIAYNYTQYHPIPDGNVGSFPKDKYVTQPLNISRFLKKWTNGYYSHKEMFLYIFKYAKPGMLIDKDLEKEIDFYNYLIDSSLYQMKIFEDLRLMGQNEVARESLTNNVQEAIHRNQNPKNCTDNEVLGYEPKESCGIGCQVNQLAYGLAIALMEGKPLVVTGSQWHNFNTIFDIIMPLSQTCHYHKKKYNKLKMKLIEFADDYKVKEFLTPAFPANIKEKIEEFHTDPYLWWMGQLIKYILRLKPIIWNKLKPIHFASPIVGIHVRRTEEIMDGAKSYPVGEYMKYVELYFRKIELTQRISQKTVYLASNDWKVIEKFRSR
ncbi:Alpha-(1,6)-fucosyltransferase [Thelohanellus kitauei]|uniref:Alpha-(1,6)-fucosyltransferase n=1 Tax=Thelohanellus kitauei TaxID=669202 RepID=A0A0C2MHE1_THEKT|nr:Alpha-(1,6)-fucosyltransferase [Thelohanellus kitauei]